MVCVVGLEKMLMQDPGGRVIIEIHRLRGVNGLVVVEAANNILIFVVRNPANHTSMSLLPAVGRVVEHGYIVAIAVVAGSTEQVHVTLVVACIETAHSLVATCKNEYL